METRIPLEGTGINGYHGGDQEGERAPLVFLHGITCRWQDFLPLLGGLEGEYPVHALDFRGHGGSDRRPGQYDFTDYAGDTARFLGTLKEPPVILGHSMGGLVAALTAGRSSQVPRGLILFDPPLFVMEQEISWTRDTFLLWYEASEEREPELIREKIRRKLPGLPEGYYRDRAADLLELDRTVLEPALNLNGKGYSPFDRREVLRNLPCPVLIFYGDPRKGAVLGPREAEVLKGENPSFRLVQVPGAGHSFHKTRAERILPEIRRFLESLPPGDAPV